jgi:hypothetical protein
MTALVAWHSFFVRRLSVAVGHENRVGRGVPLARRVTSL